MPQPPGNPVEPLPAARRATRGGLLSRALSALGGALRLLALLLIALWLAAIIFTDQVFWLQYIYWVNPLLVLAACVLVAVAVGLSAVARTRRWGKGTVWACIVSLMAMGTRELNVAGWMAGHLGPQPPKGVALRVTHWNLSQYDVRAELDIGLSLSQSGTPDLAALNMQNNPRLWQQITHAMTRSDQPPVKMTNAGFHKVFTRFPVRSARTIVVPFAGEGGPEVVALPPIVRRAMSWAFDTVGAQQRAAMAVEPATVTACVLDVSGVWGSGEVLTVWVVDFPSNPAVSKRGVADRFRAHTQALIGGGQFPVPDIVIGDVNIPGGSGSLGALVPGCRPVSRSIDLGRPATWPRPRPLLHIDHALAGPRLAAGGYQVIDPGASEHMAQTLLVWPSKGAHPGSPVNR